MGFVIVLVYAPFAGWDGVPDPLGWALVIAGLVALRRRLRGADTLLVVTALAALVSVVTYPPGVTADIDPSLGWVLSLPQLAFCILMCGALAPDAEDLAGRFAALRWVYLALAVIPVLVYGGGLDALALPMTVVVRLAGIYFVYLLFRVSKRPFALP